jgi:phospholipid/cholesterol/gamma-HCH transport system substrate-binding protein
MNEPMGLHGSHDLMAAPDSPSPPPASLPSPQWKALLLLAFTTVLVLASAVYILYARGAFEAMQQLVLVADDAEGAVVGMDMTFAGFPIGRVHRIELGQDGKARILVEVPRKDAHWLRQSSVFTLVRGLVGGSNLRAYSGILTDPPLPDGAMREVLRGDATADIPRLVIAARQLLENLTALSSSEGDLGASLAQLRQLSTRLNGPRGTLGVLLGSDQEARKLLATLEGVGALVQSLNGLTARADLQVFGAEGVMPQTRVALEQLRNLLAQAGGSLQKVDALLVDAQAVGANVRVATQDLGALRAEVETSLRKVDSLINEINRKWPFARDTEIKLP